MTGHRVAALHSFSVPSKVDVHRFPFLLIILTIIPAAHSTLYCDAEGLMYSDEQQSQIDALLMSQMFHTDGATAVKAHPTQGYLYIPDDCTKVVTKLNSVIGGGRDSNGNVRGGGGQLFCKTESGDVDVEMLFSNDCEKDAWYLTQFRGLSSPTTTQTTTPTSTPTSTQTTTPTTTPEGAASTAVVSHARLVLTLGFLAVAMLP